MSQAIKLSRVDYAQVGTNNRGCIELLPMMGPNQQQKVAAGGHSGVIISFTRRKRDTIVGFKTLPGPKVDCLCLGGALGTVQDKIFFAAGNAIKGYSKKGKQFFAFETNLTEPVTSMYIYGVDMFLCGTYTFNHFHDCADSHYFLSGDRINDVLCLPVVEGSWVGRGITPVLACDDRTAKVLDGSQLAYQVPLGGPPSILRLYQDNGGADGSLVLYGTKDGRIGLMELPAKSGKVVWEVGSPNGTACVTAIVSYDLNRDGEMEIIIGRDDGIIEIWAQSELSPPKMIQTEQCNESVTGMKCGRVGSAIYDEIVVSTYTGWVFGLTTEPTQKEVSPNQEVVLDPDAELKIRQLKAEIEQLQAEVERERTEYHSTTQAPDGVSAVPIFPMNDRFTLIKDEAAYMLALELMIPIDYVMIQCDVPIDLLDVEKNSAVVSVTPCEPNSGNCLLATYRCQANTTRLEIKIRSIEGQFGTLQAYVAPRTHPKICQVRQYPIKPLSLHQRSHLYDSGRPQNILKLTGNFSLAEAHSWVVFCLPDLPEKPPPGEQAVFWFASTFTTTQLEATYSKNWAVYRSDNVSTIAILRDVLSKEATRKKIKLDITFEISEDSVAHTLQLLHPKLEYQVNLARKVHLAEALKEVSMQNGEAEFMKGELKDLLTTSDDLASEHKKQQAHLERIYGVVTDLFIDKFKFKGQSVKQKVPQLLQILDQYNLENLLNFFQNPN